MKLFSTRFTILLLLSIVVAFSSCGEKEPEMGLFVTSVYIYDFDFKPIENGEIDYADLYVQINKFEDESVKYKTEFVYNIENSDLPIRLQFPTPFMLEDETIYSIKLYDRDTTSWDDLITDLTFYTENYDENLNNMVFCPYTEELMMVVHYELKPL